MALLQISEPGESPQPHQRRVAIGIDLGTTNSLVATVRNSIPVVLNDAQGHPLLPSVVRYCPDGAAQVGHSDRQGLRDDAAAKSWNHTHPSRGCSQDALRSSGGAGLFYCFAAK